MGTFYILEAHTPVVVPLLVWAQWFEDDEHRRVAATDIGDIFISTVFVGFNMSFTDGRPVLFETMIFGGGYEYQERYHTWDEALAGHALAVGIVTSEKPGHT